MSFYEGRTSDSPYIEMVWRGRTGKNYHALCPADANWNLLFRKRGKETCVSIEGPLTQAIAKQQPHDMDWLVIKFKLGVFMPYFPVKNLLDGGDFVFPQGIRQSFWLHSDTWELPSFDNAETFVEKLIKAEILVSDSLVSTAAEGHEQEFSERTIRRRFISATGLNPKTIQQIKRAKAAANLLESGTPILDVSYELGYADQAHLTRSLKRFYGQTPAQLTAQNQGL